MIRLRNAVTVRLSKSIACRMHFKLIWLQDNIINDVLGSLLNRKIRNVNIELCFPAEIVKYPDTQILSENGIKQVVFPDAYLVGVGNAYLSPLSGLCWRRGQYFTQSVGTVTSCFGYRTAFRQFNHLFRKCHVIENGFVVVNTRNISHFLLEDLPVLIVISNRRIPVTVIVRSDSLRGVNEILETYFSPRLDILRTDDVVIAKKAFFVTRSEEPPFVRSQYVELIRKYVLNYKMSPDNEGNRFTGELKIFISRSRSRIRAIENERELENYLSSKGYIIVFLEELSFSQQVDTIRHARVIVGLHGAGLTNVLWARSECQVIEIFPQGYFNAVFELLSRSLGFSYNSVFCDKSLKNEFGHIDVLKVGKLLERES